MTAAQQPANNRGAPIMTQPAADAVVDELRRDHELIRALASDLEMTTEPIEARDLYLRLVGELAAHEAAEEQVVFPAVRAAMPTTTRETSIRADEHDEINELIGEMQTLPPAGLAFGKRASALRLEIEAHFQAEESSLFVDLLDVIGPDESVRLAARVAVAKATAPTFPSHHRTSSMSSMSFTSTP
jgi:hemerythrin superfamily protein